MSLFSFISCCFQTSIFIHASRYSSSFFKNSYKLLSLKPFLNHQVTLFCQIQGHFCLHLAQHLSSSKTFISNIQFNSSHGNMSFRSLLEKERDCHLIASNEINWQSSASLSLRSVSFLNGRQPLPRQPPDNGCGRQNYRNLSICAKSRCLQIGSSLYFITGLYFSLCTTDKMAQLFYLYESSK